MRARGSGSSSCIGRGAWGSRSEKLNGTTSHQGSMAPTVNRGNGPALNKLMTANFPAFAVLLELAAHSKRMGMRAVAEWAPRAVNQKADSLADGKCPDFNPELRLQVEKQELRWDVLEDVLKLGRACGRVQRSKGRRCSPEPRSEADATETGGTTSRCRPVVTQAHVSRERVEHIRSSLQKHHKGSPPAHRMLQPRHYSTSQFDVFTRLAESTLRLAGRLLFG